MVFNYGSHHISEVQKDQTHLIHSKKQQELLCYSYTWFIYITIMSAMKSDNHLKFDASSAAPVGSRRLIEINTC